VNVGNDSRNDAAVVTSPTPLRNYKYFDLVMVGFVTVFICSNLIGAPKIAQVVFPFELPWGGNAFIFGAGVLFFPLSYVFGDILTEVYGYSRTRRVIWAGFGAMAFASIMATIVVAMPPAPSWNDQSAFATVFAQTPRIAAASIIAYLIGEFVNSFVLAKMKVADDGKRMGWRFVASTVCGQGVDSLIFYPLAFAGIWKMELLVTVILAQWGLKVLVEIVFLPITIRIVNALKRAEQEDYFDRNTNFTPFSLK
jgi:queuosine precursor transporter